VTYDRRGNSRSPRPPGWSTTSVAEQADDAAGLIQSLGLSPAVVFGASAGGLIALNLMLRHPHLVRAGIVQEPSLFSVLPDPQAALAPRRALLEETLKAKGPRAAVEALMRYLNDDGVFAAIPSDILERMLGNADTILTIEGPGFASWQPRTDELVKLNVPLTLMLASDTLPVYTQVTTWLRQLLKTEPVIVPGLHGFYFYRPQDLADTLRELLNRLPQN
jgi:pimeloyl-ACP methyl ester carboxylesterase